jgi:CRISPR system Cascade subunit CasE
MAFPSKERKERDDNFLEPYKPDEFPEDGSVKAHLKRPEAVHVPRTEDSGFLFRIDPQPRGRVMILVQSAVKPDWDYAFRNAGYLLAAPPQVKMFEPCFAEEQHLRFRLMANPTRKIDTKSGPNGQRRNGKRVPVPADQLYEWLSRRAESAGFSIDKDSTTVQPAYIYVNRTRNGNGQSLRSARYDGILKITDPARFQQTVVQGIGPGKAFGFGLLSLAKV